MGSFIWMILIGLVAGLIARAIKPGADAMGCNDCFRDSRGDCWRIYSQPVKFKCGWYFCRFDFIRYWGDCLVVYL